MYGIKRNDNNSIKERRYWNMVNFLFVLEIFKV